VAAPELPPPEEVRGTPSVNTPTTQSVRLLDTSVAADAMRLQQRLIGLGFLSGTADGKWGPKSRRALAEFKVSKQLDADSLLDMRTQELLLADNMPLVPRDDVGDTAVSPALYGGWTNSQGECGDGRMPPLL